MPRKNRDAVEQPLGRGIRLGQTKNHCVGIYPVDADWLAANHERIPLRGMRIFIKLQSKTKNDIVCSKGLPIRETKAMPEFHSVLQTLVGDFPLFRKRSFAFL